MGIGSGVGRSQAVVKKADDAATIGECGRTVFNI